MWWGTALFEVLSGDGDGGDQGAGTAQVRVVTKLVLRDKVGLVFKRIGKTRCCYFVTPRFS